MNKVQYGTTEIIFTHKINPRLKNNYITVDSKEGVILQSPPLDTQTATMLVKKKAAWIIKKQRLVTQKQSLEITTGSRLPYLGKRYYVKITTSTDSKTQVHFTYSKFAITIPPQTTNKQQSISQALQKFYQQKATEKLLPRIHYWIKRTGLSPHNIQLRKMNKRWGSCTKQNRVIFNYSLVKLSFSLIDYVIVHELCHIKYKRHSKAFWKEIGKYLPDYKRLDETMGEMRL